VKFLLVFLRYRQFNRRQDHGTASDGKPLSAKNNTIYATPDQSSLPPGETKTG
jgi:hypothetical protein